MVTYDRQEVGKRLACRRREMGLTGEEMGRQIGKKGKYYRDIENGRCGMSVETLMLLAEKMGLNMLSHCDGRVREGAVNLLKVYLESVSK